MTETHQAHTTAAPHRLHAHQDIAAALAAEAVEAAVAAVAAEADTAEAAAPAEAMAEEEDNNH